MILQPNDALTVVTLRGDCLKLLFQRSQTARPTKDGTYYHFHVYELSRNAKVPLLLSGFVFSYDRNVISNLEEKVHIACINDIRKLFDQQNIPRAKDDHSYAEFSIEPSDYEPREPPASDGELREFILLKTYWLGHKTSPNPGRYWVNLSDEHDLSYLGVQITDVTRESLFLEGEGFLELKESSPAAAKPTHKLRKKYELLSEASRPQLGSSTSVVPLRSLPGLPDLEEALSRLLSKESPLSVIFIDLDNFKQVNDTYGDHAAGDRCLEAVVELAGSVILNRGKLYRRSGDEFIILLPNTVAAEARETGERIRAAVDLANPVEKVKVTCSVGVASSEHPELRTAASLVGAADKAMYASKNGTKNTVSVWPVALPVVGQGEQRSEGFLPASQEAIDVRLESAHSQDFSIVVTNNADEPVRVNGVLPHFNETPLGTINRPTDGKMWMAEPHGRIRIPWPQQANITTELVTLRGQWEGSFIAFVDFVFQCVVNRQAKEFKKRIRVQVDAVNRSAVQY